MAEGDLDFRVEAPADDELRVLVDLFNTMTADLARKEAQLEESHRARGDQRTARRRAGPARPPPCSSRAPPA
ncbi:MAG: hypothetical protein R2991_11225 [Thermoanaerobaculia bacterium]